MQTILGAGGAIGVELAKILPAYTDAIRLVSRAPQKVNTADELFPADITKAAEVDEAVKGSEVVPSCRVSGPTGMSSSGMISSPARLVSA